MQIKHSEQDKVMLFNLQELSKFYMDTYVREIHLIINGVSVVYGWLNLMVLFWSLEIPHKFFICNVLPDCSEDVTCMTIRSQQEEAIK